MPDLCVAVLVGGLIIGAGWALIYLHQQKKLRDEDNRRTEEFQREKLWNAGIETAIQQALSAEVTDSTVLAEVKGLFAKLKLTGYAVIARNTYSSLLSCLARQPGNTELRVYVLEMGRLAYGVSRPEGVPTLYDEQAVQNDILVRTAGGGQSATPIQNHSNPPVLQTGARTSPPPSRPPGESPYEPQVKHAVMIAVILGIAVIIGTFVVMGYISRSGVQVNKSTRTKEGTGQEEDKRPIPYRVAWVEDNSVANRKRTSVEIVFDEKTESSPRIHSTMLSVARLYGADAVFVYAYWPGDDWKGVYTAARLEWGKDGKGWSSGDTVPVDGKFDCVSCVELDKNAAPAGMVIQERPVGADAVSPSMRNFVRQLNNAHQRRK